MKVSLLVITEKGSGGLLSTSVYYKEDVANRAKVELQKENKFIDVDVTEEEVRSE